MSKLIWKEGINLPLSLSCWLLILSLLLRLLLVLITLIMPSVLTIPIPVLPIPLAVLSILTLLLVPLTLLLVPLTLLKLTPIFRVLSTLCNPMSLYSTKVTCSIKWSSILCPSPLILSLLLEGTRIISIS